MTGASGRGTGSDSYYRVEAKLLFIRMMVRALARYAASGTGAYGEGC